MFLRIEITQAGWQRMSKRAKKKVTVYNVLSKIEFARNEIIAHGYIFPFNCFCLLNFYFVDLLVGYQQNKSDPHRTKFK